MGLTDLEQAALSGELFQPRSNSPTLSESSVEVNTDDELASDLEPDLESDDDGKAGFISRRRQGRGTREGGGESTRALIEPEQGPRTGIKGVLNDKKAHTTHTRNETNDRARELRKEMERTAITAKSPGSSKTISGAGAGASACGDGDGDGRDEWKKKRMMEFELNKKGLKEVGKTGFVSAVEKPGWVMVLIYEPVRHILSSSFLLALYPLPILLLLSIEVEHKRLRLDSERRNIRAWS